VRCFCRDSSGETAEQFIRLMDRLRDDLRPAGALEEVLVEKIAICYWRLRRVLRSENGEIRKGLDGVPAARASERKMMKLLHPERAATPKNDADWMECERARRSLPDDDVVDKILRYETTVERQLYRAVHLLERLQQRRNGEEVPPPVSVGFWGAQ
jgi:hypothetical protein